MIMQHVTHRTLHKKKSMNWVSNRFCIHCVLQIWSLDYYLFPNPKRWLCVRRFERNEEIEWKKKGYFGGFGKWYYLKGIEKLKNRWTRCIELKGEYIER